MLTLKMEYGLPFKAETEDERALLNAEARVIELKNQPWKAHFVEKASRGAWWWPVLVRSVQSIAAVRDVLCSIDWTKTSFRECEVSSIGAVFENALIPQEELLDGKLNYHHLDTRGTAGSDIPSVYHLESNVGEKTVEVVIPLKFVKDEKGGMEKTWRLIWSVQRKVRIERKLRQMLSMVSPLDEDGIGAVERLRKEILLELASFTW